jgi:site-specific DNA-adenine methylase
MNHFYISWPGNKRAEFKHIEKYVIDTGIELICEPFCGSGAFSFYMSKKYPKKFKYILNDNDQYLIELYNICKDVDKRDKKSAELKTIMEGIKDKKDYLALETGFNRWFIHHKACAIRSGLYPQDKKINSNINLGGFPMSSFLDNEKVEIRLGDGVKLIEEFRDDDMVFMFIDPPYLNTCNDFYTDKTGLNIYEWFFKNNINSFRCKTMLVLENNWIINFLFGANVKARYGKKYQTSKKNTEHVIITNY